MSDVLKKLAVDMDPDREPAMDAVEYAKSLGLPVETADPEKFKVDPGHLQQAQQMAATPPGDLKAPEQKPPTDMGKDVKDTAKGMLEGAGNVLINMWNAGIDALDGIDGFGTLQGKPMGKVIDDADKYKGNLMGSSNDPTAQQVARGIVQYGAPVAAAMATGGSTLTGLATGAGIDFMTIDPHQERLSTLVLEKAPELKNYAVLGNTLQYLKNDPNDTELQNRFKNAVEGGLVGMGLIGSAKALSKVFTGTMELGRSAKQYMGITRPEKVATSIESESVKIATEAELAANEAKMGANAPEQMSLFDSPPVTKGEDGMNRLNMDHEDTASLLETYAKNRSEESLARQKRGWDDVRAEAEAFRQDPAKMEALYKWDPKQRPLSEVEEAVIQMDLQHQPQVVADRAAKAVASGSDEDIAAFVQSLDGLKFANAIQEGSGSVAGAAFNIRKAVKDGASGKSIEEFVKAQQGNDVQKAITEQLLKFSGGKEEIKNLAATVKAMQESGVPLEKALPEAAKRGVFGKIADTAAYVAINGMLSSPKTTIANILSNGIMTANSFLTNATASVLGTLRGNPEAVTLGQQQAYLRSFFSSFGELSSSVGASLRSVKNSEAVQSVKGALKGEATGVSSTVKLDFIKKNPISAENYGVTNPVLAKLIDTLGFAASIPTKMNATADAGFSVGLYRAKMAELVQAKAEQALANAGKVEDPRKFVQDFVHNYTSGFAAVENATKEANAAVQAGKLNQQQGKAFVQQAQGVSSEMYGEYMDMVEKAMDHAQKNTFSKALDPESIPGWLDQGIEKGGPLGRVALPFFKTNANIIRETMSHSLASFVLPETRAAIMSGGKDADIAVAKIINGTMFTGFAAYLATEGLVTGPEPANYKITKALQEADSNGLKGWQPNSLHIGGNYYSMNRLDPMVSFLRLGAVMAQARNFMDEEEYTRAASLAGTALGDFLTPEMMVDGVSRYMEAYNEASKYGDDKGKVSAALQDYASRFMPFAALQRDVRNLTDPAKESIMISKDGKNPVENFIDGMMNRYQSMVPWWSESMPIQRNLFGEPMMVPAGLGPDLVSPIATSRGASSQLVQRLQALSDYYDLRGDKNAELHKLSLDLPQKFLNVAGVTMELPPDEYEKYQVLAGGLDPKTGKPIAGISLRDALDQTVDQIWSQIDGGKMSPEQYNKLVGEVSKVIKTYRDNAKDIIINDPKFMDRWMKKKQRLTEIRDVTPSSQLGL